LSRQTRLTVTIPAFIPNPPTNLSALASNGATILTFAPGFDGGSPITTYLYSTDGNQYKDTKQSNAPLTITGLTNSVPYTITLKAVTAAGTSLPSAPVTVTPTGDAPLPLKAVSLVAGSTPGTINVSVVYSDGSQICRYISEILGTGQINGTTGIIQAFSGATFVISLVAVNSYGVSSQTSVSISLPATVPAPPEILLPILNSDSSAIISYKKSSSGNPTTAVLYSFDGITYTNSNQTASPVTIRGLVNGRTYNTVYLKLENSMGTSAPSAPFTLAPISGAPAAFTNVEAKPGYAQATVSFTAPPGVTTFLYSIDSNNFNSFYTNPYTITGLNNDRINTIYLAGVANNTRVSPIVSVTVTPSSYIIAPPHALTGYNGISSAIITFSQYPLHNPVISYLYSLNGGSYIDSGKSTNPLTINNLQNGTPYTITLKTKTVDGVSDPSSSIRVTPTSGAPAPLTNVVATAGNAQATVAFTAPVGITTFQYSIDGVIFNKFYTTTYIISSLTNNTNYTIYLAAVANNGNSISSLSTVTVRPSTTIINIPYGLTGYSSFNSAIITFNQGATQSPITSYLYSVDGRTYLDSRTSTSPVIIPNLINFISYPITLKAVTADGQSEPSASVTVNPSVNAPAPVTNVVPTPGYQQATISFTAPSGVTRFQYSTDGINFIQFYTNPYTITNLITGINNKIYLATVAADNTISTLTTVTVTPSTSIVNSPYGLIGYNSFNSAIIIFNQGATKSRITTYLYSSDGVNYTDTLQSSSPLTIRGLTNSQRYTITLKAVTADGDQSDPSVSVDVTPSNNAPASPTNISPIPGYAQASISFIDPDGTNSFLYFKDTNVVSFNNNPYNITGLTNGTSYTIYLAAVATDNSISNLVPFTVTPTSDIVNPPNTLTGYGSSSSAIITFSQSTTSSLIKTYLYSLDGAPYLDSLQSSSPLTIDNLTTDQLYRITLKAKTENGMMSGPSGPIDVTTSSFAPAPLTNVVSTPGYQQATISFTAPIGVTNFQYSEDGIHFNQFYTNPFVIDYLANNITHTLYVGAFSPINGSISKPVKVTVIPSSNIINSPDTLTGYGSLTSAIITFKQGVTQNPVIDYEYSLNGLPYVSSGYSASPLTINGLENDKEYAITLKAVTIDGKSAPSASINAKPSSIAPSPLTNIDVTPGDSNATVRFTAPFGINTFMYSTNGLFLYPFYTNPSIITGLDNDTTYTIYLAAVNTTDNSISNLESFTVTPTV
jgi:hypothetical protein